MCPATSASACSVVLDDVDAAQERLHRQPAGVPGAAAGGQHVVGAGAVVAQRDRRPRADEDRAGVAHPHRHLARRPGSGSPGARRRRRRRPRSPASRSSTRTTPDWVPSSAVVIRSRVLGGGHLPGHQRPGRRRRAPRWSVTSTAPASGSCSAWLIRSAATCAGSAVSSARIGDLGRAGLGVDADQAAQQPLGRRHVDVARPGDHVDRLAGPGAVAEHGDRLGPADGVDLGDARAARRRRGPPGRAGRRGRAAAGEATAIDSTPAICAGTTFMTTLRQQRRQAAGHVEARPGAPAPSAR